MSLHAGRVEADLLEFFLQAFLAQRVEDPLPHAPLAPAVEPLPDAVGLAEPGRQVVPRDARLQHEHDRVDEPPVVLRRPPRVARFARQQVANRFPLLLSPCVSLRHIRSSLNDKKDRKSARITRDE